MRIDTEKNFLDVLDKVDEITAQSVDATHVFTLSQVYEGLLLKMGEKGNDGSRPQPTPRTIVSMSLRLAIPWRVGLHQSPPLLRQPGTILKESKLFE